VRYFFCLALTGEMIGQMKSHGVFWDDAYTRQTLAPIVQPLLQSADTRQATPRIHLLRDTSINCAAI